MKVVTVLKATGAVAACAAALLLLAAAWILRGPIIISGSPSAAAGMVSEDLLRSSVRTLCSDLAPRDYLSPSNLDRAADWIARRFRAAGLSVSEHAFPFGKYTYRNVLATREGADPRRGLVIIGAHYDTCGPHPGADDNASGVAVLLELVRTLPPERPACTQVFAAFVNEEPPFFGGDDMGSAHYARALQRDHARVELMVALDLVGYFSDEPGSQAFPLPGLRLLYPGRGDFIAVVGDLGAGRWIRAVKKGMRSAGSIPVYSFRGPSSVPGIDWSDHLSFRKLGMPGVLVTDTAFLRNPNYHSPHDTPDTLDYGRMAGVVRALHGVLRAAD